MDLLRCQAKGASTSVCGVGAGSATGLSTGAGEEDEGVNRGNMLHPIRLPTISAGMIHRNLENGRTIMWLIVLEAAAALALLLGLVWWTMFSGRRRGELESDAPPQDAERGGNKKLKG